MSVVLDASVLAALLLPDETSSLVEAVENILAEAGAVAPKILWYEIRNTLLVANRRKRLSDDELADALSVLHDLAIDFIDVPNSDLLFRLARKHALSIYDAAYLSLALEKRRPLATLDKTLRQAARRETALFAP